MYDVWECAFKVKYVAMLDVCGLHFADDLKYEPDFRQLFFVLSRGQKFQGHLDIEDHRVSFSFHDSNSFAIGPESLHN